MNWNDQYTGKMFNWQCNQRVGKNQKKNKKIYLRKNRLRLHTMSSTCDFHLKPNKSTCSKYAED